MCDLNKVGRSQVLVAAFGKVEALLRFVLVRIYACIVVTMRATKHVQFSFEQSVG